MNLLKRQKNPHQLVMIKPERAQEGIWVKGAREHNLKSINVFIPRNKITVITGLSGSGKSSLAFDTLYAEGQRRYIESLSAYARYFMDKFKPPDVDSIFGLSPVVAIDQKTINTNPRSTVGTVTEIYDYLRLLFAKLGSPNCPEHKKPFSSASEDDILKIVMKEKNKTAFQVLSPVAREKKGEFTAEIQSYIQKGFLRARVDGEMKLLEKIPKLNKRKPHNIDLLIDSLYVEKKYADRLKESLKQAALLSDGLIKVEFYYNGGLSSAKVKNKVQIFSTKLACPECLMPCPEIEPRLFSFNSTLGACPECKGLGYKNEIEGEELAGRLFFTSQDKKSSLDSLEEDHFEQPVKVCPACRGKKLKPSALAVLIGGKNISELSGLSVNNLQAFLRKLKFPARYKVVAQKIMEKILGDLDILTKVGVSYLSLDRSTKSLSGGEAQRIILAGQLSSVIIGVLYILDEPSIGLHPSDHNTLLQLIKKIKKRQNTIVMVEHDEQTIREADYIVDIGPEAGGLGGRLVFQGSLKGLVKNKKSLTGDYLAKRKAIKVPQKRRKAVKFLEIKGAGGNNLKNIDFKIPLSSLVSVTGVSGSGKSSLVVDTLYKALANKIYKSGHTPLSFKKILGAEKLDKVIIVDQKPIGRTSRSIPATYVGVMSLIRNFMSGLSSAKVRGFSPSHFSFNLNGGRCSYCDGAGVIKQEMHFLSTATAPCEMCQGKRYSPDLLSITYKDKNISDILNMTVKQAVSFFENHPLIYRLLKRLESVGLSYLTLGQSSASLSGGEAQRIKLTRELSKRETSSVLYILDEPTTGLHFDDIKKLLKVLNYLVERGNTVIVIEHNMDVVKCSDYVVDLGAGGGAKGGRIIAQGVPEKVARSKTSLTGLYLKKALKG